MAKHSGKRDRLILCIGILKLVKGVLLLALAAGVFGLINDNLSEQFQIWIKQLNADAHIHYLSDLLNKISTTNDGQYLKLGISIVVYALLFFAEGIGLLMRKLWGEILTIIITGSFLPLEIYELVKKFSAVKLCVLILNAVIVAYLIWRVKNGPKPKKA
jgi:uncharacterized membrane protein (DUF2068 family)